MFKINNPNNSYIYGLLQADGNFYETTRNRGKIRLEISKRDKDIIYKLSNNLNVNTNISERTRDTNFKEEYDSISLTIFSLEFRNKIKSLGLHPGKKDISIKPPNKEYKKQIILEV